MISMIKKDAQPSTAIRNFLSTAIACCIALSLLACTPPQTPEEEIHAYIASSVESFEDRRTSALRDYISRDYRDGYGNSKKDLIRIAAGYFLRNPEIHLTTKIRNLIFSDKQASAELILDVAVTPTAYAEDDLRILQGELHRLRIYLTKEGDWLLQSLEWQRINAEEFSGQGD